jgi:hypothetical protein
MKAEKLLGRLLEHRDELTDAEEGAFSSMLSSVNRSPKRQLTPRQRDWAEAVYEKLDLQRHYLAERGELDSGRRGKKSGEPSFWWEEEQFHPLRPPGR